MIILHNPRNARPIIVEISHPDTLIDIDESGMDEILVCMKDSRNELALAMPTYFGNRIVEESWQFLGDHIMWLEGKGKGTL